MNPIEELLTEVKNRGLLVRQWYERTSHPMNPNIPQKATGGWWCEILHLRNGHRDSDVGDSAQEALHAALERAKGLRGMDNRPLNLAPSQTRAEVAITDEEAELM